tara:strand:+ start:5520 stop:5705 length:186 start_codon:yes stop_codon:yes gene_type:complete
MLNAVQRLFANKPYCQGEIKGSKEQESSVTEKKQKHNQLDDIGAPTRISKRYVGLRELKEK